MKFDFDQRPVNTDTLYVISNGLVIIQIVHLVFTLFHGISYGLDIKRYLEIDVGFVCLV
jgi:hypothetical protein